MVLAVMVLMLLLVVMMMVVVVAGATNNRTSTALFRFYPVQVVPVMSASRGHNYTVKPPTVASGRGQRSRVPGGSIVGSSRGRGSGRGYSYRGSPAGAFPWVPVGAGRAVSTTMLVVLVMSVVGFA